MTRERVWIIKEIKKEANASDKPDMEENIYRIWKEINRFVRATIPNQSAPIKSNEITQQTQQFVWTDLRCPVKSTKWEINKHNMEDVIGRK